MKKSLLVIFAVVLMLFVASAMAADVKTVNATTGAVISTAPITLTGVTALKWTITAAGVHFYNCTSPTGVSTASYMFSITPTVGTVPFFAQLGEVFGDVFGKKLDGISFSTGCVVSGTATAGGTDLVIFGK